MQGEGPVHRRPVLAAVGTVGAATVAGCSLAASDEPTVEVVENEFGDALELSGHAVENRRILGTDAVVATGTITNTTAEPIRVSVASVFYDAADAVLGEDGPAYAGTEITPGGSHEYEEVTEGRVETVDRVELRVVEPEL